MNKTDSIVSFLNEGMPEYMAHLRNMVEVNSYTYNPEGVDQIGNMTADLFLSLGFSAQYLSSVNPSCGRHLLLRSKGSTGKQIAMISHLDTVYTSEEEQRNNFRWREEGNRIYGPGTVDIKGGSLVMFMTLSALKKFYPEKFETTNWLLIFNATEEVWAPDVEKIYADALGVNTLAALVFEGGGIEKDWFSLCVSRKGKATFRVSVEGIAGHSGNCHNKGASAILQLAHTVQQIESFTDYKNELTFNVGKISGGEALNRIPHYAKASVEMRALSSQTFEKGLEAIKNLSGVGQIQSADGGHPCRVKIELLSVQSPWPENDKTERLVEIWQRAGESLGYTPVKRIRGGISDANLVWDKAPTLDALGSAGLNSHCSVRSKDGKKEQEYTEISSFVPKATINTLAIVELLSLPEQL